MAIYDPNQFGKIILLHGASSSGKSTLARALQTAIDEPFWHISIDHLRDSGVLPTQRIQSGEFVWRDMRENFFEGFHQSLAAYARAGNNLIVEHILDTQGWLERLAALFQPFDVYFVGVHCSLEELARREAARADREIGSAARDYRTIHRHLRYDLELQGEAPVDENIKKLMASWRDRQAPSVFAQIALAT